MTNANAIAVIGMSCRFPGAKNIDEFWNNLKNGIESITEFSDEDMINAGANQSEINNPDYVKAGFILEDEDLFDASFFGYSPKEAGIMDPQQRLFLETAWKSLEDGGYAIDQYNGSIGIFAGARMSSYFVNVLNSGALSVGNPADLQLIIANDKDYLTSRVSFKLNLKGPSITVQSACSTSLVAVHLACDSLLSGSCDMALAGGVSLNIPQKAGYLFQDGMVLSPDGHCRVFDAGANGLVPGNGVGIVLLKRLEDALADHDKIHSVIIGSAVNNDGSNKIGYTTPSVKGQIEVVREAQTVSEIQPESISYIEAHGTGTSLGDPVEVEALSQVFKSIRNKTGLCAIGSVKSNIGHLDTAAGIAGFIKTVLSLKHGYLLPSLNYEKPNPKIDFDNSPFYVNTQLLPWKTNGYPRRAGVSSFGFGGTNAHVILEQAPERSFESLESSHPLHLLTLSAKTEKSLKQQIQNYHIFLDENRDEAIGDICFTANTGRSHFQYRFAAIAESIEDLRLQLTLATQGKKASILFKGVADNRIEPAVAFDLSNHFLEYEQLTDIGSGSHVLQTHYKLPLSRADKKDYLLILSALGKLYIHGAKIDWESFYQDVKPHRVSLPTYPFERKRHWRAKENRRRDVIPFVENRNDNIMPFMGQQISCAAPVFQFELSIFSCPFLKYHRIHGKIVIPVGVFWEMVLSAGKAHFKTGQVCLKDMTQHEAMLISDSQEPLKVQVVFNSDNITGQNTSFDIFCEEELSDRLQKNWKKYVSGEITNQRIGMKVNSLDDIQATCNTEYDVPRLISSLQRADNVSENGERSWTFQKILISKNEALGKIEFSESFLVEIGACQLHPSIFEPCLQTMFAIPLAKGDDALNNKIFLPIGFNSIDYISTLPKEVWCHASIRPGKNWQDSEFIADFQLFTPQGEGIARILGAYMRQASANAFLRNTIESLCYTIQWKKVNKKILPQNPSRSSLSGCWFILGDQKGFAEKLGQRIQTDGGTWIILNSDGRLHIHTDHSDFKDKISVDTVPTQKTFDSIFKEKLPKYGLHCNGVIQCWGINSPPSEDLTPEELKNNVFLTYSSTVYLLRAIVSSGHKITDFCLLTQGAQAVVERDLASVTQAPLWGMRKCLEREHPELNIHIFDLDKLDRTSQLQELCKILSFGTIEREIAFRDGNLYAPRLMPLGLSHDNLQPTDNKLNFDSNATYLITGGFGGVGMETAGWLTGHGVTHLVLIGRSDPSPSVQKKINVLQTNGVQILTAKADVTDFETLSKLISDIRESMPPLKGVFHLAGILGEGDMLRQDLESAKKIIAPKVEGAWNLHRATHEDPLDCFILFSSISSLWGGHGLGAYAGANSFLDALAHYRKASGLPGLSINWGAFSQVGMIAEDEKGSQLRQKFGLKAFSPLNALSHFNRVKELPQACIVEMDWRCFFAQSDMKNDPFFSVLVSRYGGVAKVVQEESYDLQAELATISHEKRYEILENYLIRKVSDALGIDTSDISMQGDLLQMGMDSLIFLSLAQTISNDLHIKIVPHKLFENPTIEGLLKQFIEETQFEAPDDINNENHMAFLVESDPENRYAPFGLTDIQHAYWIGRSGVTELGDVACHVYFEIATEQLDLDRYTVAWQRVIDRHDMLRAIILPDGHQQILENIPPFLIHITDLRNESSDTITQKTALIREEMSHQVRPADQWPLFEVRATLLDTSQTLLHISIDILIADGYSIYNLMQEVFHYYQTPELTIPPMTCTFRDYVLAEAKFRESELYHQSRQYWLDGLSSLPPSSELPLAKTPSELKKTRFVRREKRLDANTWAELQKCASQAGLTRANILLAAYAEVLATWSKSQKFTLNLTFFHRLQGHPQINEVIGDFTSLILLKVDSTLNVPFKERALRIQTQLWKDMEYRYFSGVRVLQELSRKNQGSERTLMPVVFTSNLGYENIRQESTGLSLPGKMVYSISQTPQVWIDNQISEENNELVIVWDAVEELFPDKMLDDMFKTYCWLLEMLAHDETVLDKYDFALIPEYQYLSRGKTESEVKSESTEMLHSLFFSQAGLTPDNMAIISSGKSLSYKELSYLSLQIGRQLKKNGAMPNTLIAVVMEKGWEQIAAVLGILNSGAAYLPIDAAVPKERLWHLLEDGQVRLILTQSRLEKKLEWPDDVICISVDTFESINQNSEETSNLIQNCSDLAYVIHTSGSTGVPKGVMIDHKGAVNTITDINKRFNINDRDSVLALSALNFDLSVYDIFGTLGVGGTIIIPDASGTKDPGHWLTLIKQHEVTVWNSVPALMQMLVEYLAGRKESAPDSLRLILLSGDWIPLDLPDRIKSICPQVEIISLGGATEASIWSILYPINAVDPQWKSIPYGRPMANQNFHVLNENMENCPDWVTGDLYISGIGLAKGYWHDEVKTGNAFIHHVRTGERLYQTGDLGRYLPDGNIEFLGREDQQVKINGYRIELGEIEAVMEQHPSVKNAVAIAMSDSDSKKFITAYVIIDEGADCSKDDLKKFLTNRLAEYMIPTALMILQEFPITANGKIDRKNFPWPDSPDQSNESTYFPPETELEFKIAEIIEGIIKVNPVSIHDRFFSVGANSLDMVKIQNNLNTSLEIDISVVDIFEHSTIHSLSQFISTNIRKRSFDGQVQKKVTARKMAAQKRQKNRINTLMG